MPGPPPKPTRLKLLEGNRGKRTPPENEPEPEPIEVDEVEPPEFLGKRGKQIWNRLVELWGAEGSGVLAESDVGIAALYCGAVEDVERLRRDIKKEGEVIEGYAGGKVRNPKTLLFREAADRLIKTSDRLGLSPAMRSRVEVRNPAGKGGGRLAKFTEAK